MDSPVGRGFSRPVGAARRLIAYGSLMPGGEHHDLVRSLSGAWRRGWITGQIDPEDWIPGMGYPVFRWSPDGERIPAYLLESPDLPEHWCRLDAFEGEAYRRIVIPFFHDEQRWVVGQVYAEADFS